MVEAVSVPAGAEGITRYCNIQALRGVAVLCVVLFHMLSIESKYGGGAGILPNWLDFGQFGVDLFFVISGFVMVIVTQDKTGDKQALRFLYHRATRIYPLYWIYSLILLGVYQFRPDWVIGAHNRNIDVSASFLLLPQNDYPLLSVGWTLVHEMYFYIVYFFVLVLYPPAKRSIHLLFWGILVVASDLLGPWESATLKLISSPLTVEFLTGCMIAQYAHHLKISSPRRMLLIAASILAVAINTYLTSRNSTGNVGVDGWWRIVLFGLPASFIVLFAVCAERSHFLFHNALRRLGDASYSIYLTHILSLAILGKIWSEYSSPRLWDNWIVIPLCLMTTLSIGYISYKWIETPMLKLSKKWF